MTDTNRIDAASWLTILRRRWWAILAAGVLAAALALVLSLAQADRYKATAELLFQKDDLDRTLLGVPGQDTQIAPERIAATNLALASLDDVAVNVRRRLGTTRTVEQLRDSVKIAPKGQADIITVTGEAGDRQGAVSLANAFAVEIVALRRHVAQERVQRAIDALRLSQAAGGAGDAASKRRIEQLTAIKATQQGDVDVIQPALPPRDRAAPKPLRNTLIGAVLGVILGTFAAALLHAFDKRIDDDEEIARLVGVPVLSRVPTGRRSRTQQVYEALQFLRANLQLQDPRRKIKVIAVTSPLAGDGKTTIAAGLAEVLAQSGCSVVAVDCDLRSPDLHEQLQVEDAAGLTDALLGRDPDELLQDAPREPEELLRDASPRLRVLSAGLTSLDAASLVIGLQRLPGVLARLRDGADYVIVDTPPITAAADASTVAAAADGVILVVERGRARRDLLSAVRDQLTHARARSLGVVINRAAAPIFGATYGDQRPPADDQPGPTSWLTSRVREP